MFGVRDSVTFEAKELHQHGIATSYMLVSKIIAIIV